MLRCTGRGLGSFLIYERLAVDWKHFFERLDLKNLAEARLNDGMVAYRSKGNVAGSHHAIFSQDEPSVGQEAVEEMAVPHKAAVGCCLPGHDGSMFNQRYFRLAEDGSGMVAVNRGKPLSADEAMHIAEIMTHHHDVDGLAEVFKFMHEDLAAPISLEQYNQLLRVLLFARDKERVDQTFEAVLDATRNQPPRQISTTWDFQESNGFHNICARLVDACYAFQAPDDALRDALQVLCRLQSVHFVPLVQYRPPMPGSTSACSLGRPNDTEGLSSDAQKTAASANSFLESLVATYGSGQLESKPLSSLIHLTSQGSFHSLIPVVIAVWMSLLGVRLSAWDVANITSVLVSRPQDFPLVRAVFGSVEVDQGGQTLLAGSISVQALLYTLHARGILSDNAFKRLKRLVLGLNDCINKSLVDVTSDSVDGLDNVTTKLLLQLDAGDEEAPSACTVISKSFGRLKTERDNVSSEVSTQRNNSRESGDFSYNRPGFIAWFNDFDAFATTRDEIVTKALPFQLESILASMIHTAAATLCLQRPQSDDAGRWRYPSLRQLEGNSASAVFGTAAHCLRPVLSSPISINELTAKLKDPIRMGWLNSREACGSNVQLVMSLMKHSWGNSQSGAVFPSVGPMRENVGSLYHFYASLHATVRHDVEAVRALGTTATAMAEWEEKFEPLYREILMAMRDAAQSGCAMTVESFVESRRGELEALQKRYFPSPKSAHIGLGMEMFPNLRSAKDSLNVEGLFESEGNKCPAQSPKDLTPILGLLAEVAVCTPFSLGGMFFDDVGLTFTTVPMSYLDKEKEAFQYLRSASLNPLLLRLKRELLLEHSPQLRELGPSPSKAVVQEDESPLTVEESPSPPIYNALSEADQSYLAAHGLYFVDSTAAAQQAWAAIEESASGKDLPNRSVKKMLKMYAAMCARHPPRNCKLSPKGYEERLKFGFYVEARETALMLLGSGKESRDMMRHLFYHGNKLPSSRSLDGIVEDMKLLQPTFPINPVARFSAERIREDTERATVAVQTLRRVSSAGDYAGDEQLEVVGGGGAGASTEPTGGDTDLGDGSGGVVFVVKGKEAVSKAGKRYDAYDFTASRGGAASSAVDELLLGSSEGSMAELHEAHRREKLRVNGNLASVDMSLSGVFSDAVRRANPNTLPLSPSSSFPKTDTISFTTEVSWVRGHTNSLLPEHLYRGDIYNHFPHRNIKGRGLLRETQEVVALCGGSESKRSELVAAINGTTKSEVTVASEGSPIHPVTFFGYDDHFTEDPFVPLWNFINATYSPTSSSSISGRAWYLDDIEMFELLLKNLLYRLDWENAAKLTLLMTQTPRSKRSRDHLDKVKGSKYNNRNQKTFSDVISSRTTDDHDADVSLGDSSVVPDPASGNAEWSFLTDHHVSKMFADIGDPGGFLPFKVATKLFDGRIVTKTNRMGAVNVNPLLASADLAFDDDSDNRPSVHGAEKRRGAAGIGFRQH